MVENKTAKFFGHVGLEKLTLEGTVPGKKFKESSPTSYVYLMIGLTGISKRQFKPNLIKLRDYQVMK